MSLGLLGMLASVPVALGSGSPAAWLTAGATAAVAAHAAAALRHRPPGPLPGLLLDGPAWGLVLLLQTVPPAVLGAVLSYLVIAPLLFLPRRRAVLALGVLGIVWVPAAWALPPVRTALPVVAGAALSLGALLGALGRELERRSRRQEESLQAERRAARMRGEFVSTVSHEFRTPLTSILGFVETLRAWRTLDPEEVDEFVDIVAGQTTHLARLVEDLLLIPRLDSGRVRLTRETVPLRPVVERVATAVFAGPGDGREVQVTVPGEATVRADPLRVEQILRNLLENARRYGGHHVLVEGRTAPAGYLVTVADDGPGIPDDHRERIFDPFERVEEDTGEVGSGVGLGLPIARRLARAMGGELWCEPRFPTGVRFCLRLPLDGEEGDGRAGPWAECA